jgi:hypothetical protein
MFDEGLGADVEGDDAPRTILIERHGGLSVIVKP